MPPDPILMREVDALVAENQSLGSIERLEIDAHRVYVNPSAWMTWDQDEKKTFTSMLAVYCDERGSVHGRYVDVLESGSAKKLAHYDPAGVTLY